MNKEYEVSKKKFLKLAEEFDSAKSLKKFINDNPEKGVELYNKNFKTDEPMVVSMENLYKVYDNGIQAISNLNLSIDSKEFVCLLGPSGCGKSTLLRMVAGLESISAGLLSFNKRVVNSTVPSKRGLSMVFQNYALYPYMSVSKNIGFGLKIEAKKNEHLNLLRKIIKESKNSNYTEIEKTKNELRLLKKPNEYEITLLKEEIRIAKFNSKDEVVKEKQEKLKSLKIQNAEASKLNTEKIAELKQKIVDLKKEGIKSLTDADKLVIKELRRTKFLLWGLAKFTIEERIKEVCEVVGIEQFLNRKPSELSGGQRQRVALARTISKNRKLFLFDEPLSNLDAKLRAGMRELIRKLHNRSGSTSLYVTHDQIEAMTMADKVVIMKSGFIQQVDKPLNLYIKPVNLFVAKFIGTPEINIMDANFNNKDIVKIGSTKLRIIKKQVNGTTTKDSGINSYMGIRPQHIITDQEIVENQKENVIRGKIINIQLLGNEYLLTIYHKDLGNIDLIVSSYANPKLNSIFSFYINPNKIMIFDRVTEKNITTEVNELTNAALDNWFAGVGDREQNQAIMSSQLKQKSITKKIISSIKNIKNNNEDTPAEE